MKIKSILLGTFLAYNISYAKTHNISIVGMKFVPETITASVGDTIKFTNNSKIMHNIVSPKSKVRSRMLRTNETFTLTIIKKEDILYWCEPHRAMGMKGIIYVK